jgi:hypothetical protein
MYMPRHHEIDIEKVCLNLQKLGRGWEIVLGDVVSGLCAVSSVHDQAEIYVHTGYIKMNQTPEC